jgi:two-component system NtrC family sensor kinase
VLGSHVLAVQLVNQMLAGIPDREIRSREAELHERLQQLVPSVPMASTIILSDRDATVLLTADSYPAPHISIADREWVEALRADDWPEVHFSAVTSGWIDDRTFFAVSIRRAGTGNGLPEDAFDGVVDISVDPSRVATGFNAVTHEPEDVISLVRADGHILARLPVPPMAIPRIPDDSPLLTAAADGVERGLYAGRTLGLRPDGSTGRELQVAFRQVGAFPIYVTVSRPPSAIVERWWRSMPALVALGLTSSLALAVLAFSVRRSQRSLTSSEAEFRAAFESAVMGKLLLDPVLAAASGERAGLGDHGLRRAELVGTRRWST